MTEPTAFDVLSDLLRPHAKELVVKSDTETSYYLEEAFSSSKPQMFAAVQIKKSYTSFHLFPVYTNPSLLDDLSAELKKRMQGKSCFNFNKVEDVPIAELGDLVKRCYEGL